MTFSSWFHLFVLGLFMWCHSPDIECARSPERCWTTFSDNQSKPEKFWPCFENKCRCSTTVLDCSFSNVSQGGLPWIYRLSDTKLLNFSNNNLTEISNPHFFLNVEFRNVHVLDLYNNRMTRFVPGVFGPLHKLEKVFMGGNELTYDQIATVLYVPLLRSLELKCGRLGDVPHTFFHNRSCPRLRYIDMSWNMINTLDMRVFWPLERLESLLLRYNSIETITPSYHPYLKVWIIHKNKLFNFPATCNEKGTSLYPNLTLLDLDFNYISHLPDPVCLPSLTTLSLKYNVFDCFFKNMFSLQRFPMLQRLGLTQMRNKISKMEGCTFNNSKLTHIEFAFNNVDFSSSSTVSDNVFQGCSKLEKINLDQTHFDGVTNERFQRLFKPLMSLKVLFLGKTKLKLWQDTFRNLPCLEKLYLYENFLGSIPDGVFDNLRNLTVLKLSNNWITTIPSSAFSDDLRERLVKIDLSGNIFNCACDIRPFQEWMKSQSKKFEDYKRQGYQCQNVANTTVQEFDIPQQAREIQTPAVLACLLDRSTSVLIPALVIIFILLLVLAMFKHKYRWHLRPWLYKLFHRDNRQQGHFEHDVYVAADEGDDGWIRANLLPVLEEEWNLNVFYPHRQFHPGRSELDSIGEHVSESQNMVAIFSSNFADNELRQRELAFCLTPDYGRAFPHHPGLVVVLLPGLRPQELTDSMRVALNTNYLKWKEDPEAIPSFKKCLAQALNVGNANAKCVIL